MEGGNMGLTARLGVFIADTDAKKIPEEAFEHAKVAFLDWVAVTVAGKDDPLVKKLIDYANTITGLEGKFSIPYCVANALVTGQTGTQAFTDEKVRDPGVRGLMEKITVALDPEMETLESRVEMKTTGGQTYSAFSDVLQEIPPLEIKRERVKSKCFDLCSPVIGKEKTGALADEILGMERLANVRPFAESL